MAKVASAGMIDGGLDKYITSIRLTICAGQPTSYSDISAKKLASKVLTSADFSKANGDISGRKATVAPQSAIPIDVGGTADHVVVDNGVDYYVTTCTSQALVLGGTVSTPAFSREISSPV